MAEEGGVKFQNGAHLEAHREGEGGGLRAATISGHVGVPGETATVRCGTTKGPFVAELTRDWAPLGYDRAVELFQRGYYDESHFFRAVPGFLVQFGISYSSDASLHKFANSQIPDDPTLGLKFEEGFISYAGSGPNSRTSQLFISHKPNPQFGKELWETPIGKVTSGMENVKQFYSYGDMPPWGKGPTQAKIRQDKNYIPNEFPLIDKFTTCQVTINPPDNEPLEREDPALEERRAIERAERRDDEELPAGERQVQQQTEEGLAEEITNDMMTMGAIVSGGILVFLVVVNFVLKRRKKKGKYSR